MTENQERRMSEWLEEVMPFNRENKFDEVIDITIRYWNETEEPKLSDSFGYHLLNALVSTYFKMGNLEESLKWCELYDNFDFEGTGRIDSGEKDFYIGKVHYESGNIATAYEYFSRAKQKSRSRCFQLPDGAKYKKIYAELIVCSDTKGKLRE